MDQTILPDKSYEELRSVSIRQKRVEAKKGFYIHMPLYAAVMPPMPGLVIVASHDFGAQTAVSRAMRK